MISYIKGRILKKTANSIIIENNGLGYEVFITTSLCSKCYLDQQIELFTYLHVREDSWTLFGFSNWEEKEFFLLLINVSGVGPRAALTTLSFSPLNQLKVAIGNGDANFLTKIPGIGKKIAQRIVVELKEKMEGFHTIDGEGTMEDYLAVDNDIVMEGLKALGYHPMEIKKVLPGLIKENPALDEGELIKKALRLLARV